MIAGLGLWYSASDPAYDAFTYEQAIPTLFDASGNGWDAAQATGSNQARFLTHDGRNYLRLVGLTNNVARTPGPVTASEDLDYAENLAAVDWTPAGTVSIASIYGASGNRRWWFIIRSSGILAVTFSFDGTATITYDSTVGLGSMADNAETWVRITRESVTGDLRFYTSADGINWTQLGATVATTPGPLFASTVDLVIGNISSQAGTPLAARCYRAQLRDGIDGTLVADFDPSRGNFNSATIGSSTGETWTINKSGLNPAMIVSARAFLPLTDDFYDISASAADVLRNVSGGTMVAARGCNSVSGAMEAMTLSTNTAAQGRMTLYTTTTSFAVGGRRLDANSFVARTATTQQLDYEMAIHSGRLNYAEALAANFKNGALVGSEATFQTAGSSSDTASARMRVFANLADTPASFLSGPVTDLAIYNRALTNAQIRSLSRYFAGRTGGAITV
jgi:hypothetical protein